MSSPSIADQLPGLFSPSSTATASISGNGGTFGTPSFVTRYSDFARQASDFFSKDFPFGRVKVEAKSQSGGPGSVLFGKLSSAIQNVTGSSSSTSAPLLKETFSDEFKLTAIRDVDTGIIGAEARSTSVFGIGSNGVKVKSSTALTTGNVMSQQVSILNPLLEGLKLDLYASAQTKGIEGAKVGAEFVQPNLYVTAGVDLFKGPMLSADLATRFQDIQVGAELGYGLMSQQLESYSVGISLDRAREKVSLQAMTGFNQFNAAYFQRFSDQLEVAYKAIWDSKATALNMEVGTKYLLNHGSGFVKAKVDNTGKLGLAFGTEVKPGVTVTLGALVDSNKLADNAAHKFGLDLTYTA